MHQQRAYVPLKPKLGIQTPFSVTRRVPSSSSSFCTKQELSLFTGHPCGHHRDPMQWQNYVRAVWEGRQCCMATTGHVQKEHQSSIVEMRQITRNFQASYLTCTCFSSEQIRPMLVRKHHLQAGNLLLENEQQQPLA